MLPHDSRPDARPSRLRRPTARRRRAAGLGLAVALTAASPLVALDAPAGASSAQARPAAASQPASVADRAAPRALVGTFRITAGRCSGGRVTGTYLRMILPSGGVNGPYLANSDSRCSDQTYTLLHPGTDGGLRTGSVQPTPKPAFDRKGNALARRITASALFYGTAFATATNKVDPQTGRRVPAPRITVSGNRLGGDLSAFAVTWNNQNFNQGGPKPGGATPGNTRRPSGTIDLRTGRFTLDWTSQVAGGPFDKFTGKWHFEGVFTPARGRLASTDAGQAAVGGAGTTATSSGTGTSAATTEATTGAAASGTDTGTRGTGSGAAASSDELPDALPGDVTSAQASAATLAASAAQAPGTSSAGGSPATAAPRTTTETTTRPVWSVNRPVLIAAVLLGLAAIAALLAPGLLARRRPGTDAGAPSATDTASGVGPDDTTVLA